MQAASKGVCTVAVLVLCATLCGCGMGRFNVKVSLDKGMVDKQGEIPRVEVHLVGVNASEYDVFNNYSMGKYWVHGDALARDASKHAMQFGVGRPVEQALSEKDEIWGKWQNKGSENLFILVNLPGVHEDKPGNADPRRLILLLDRKHWTDYFWGHHDMDILVKSSGPTCLTPYEVKE